MNDELLQNQTHRTYTTDTQLHFGLYTFLPILKTTVKEDYNLTE